MDYGNQIMVFPSSVKDEMRKKELCRFADGLNNDFAYKGEYPPGSIIQGKNEILAANVQYGSVVADGKIINLWGYLSFC